MKRVVAGLAVIIIIIVALMAFGGKNDNSTHNSASSSSGQAASNPTATNQVKISNFAFNPVDITVKKGTKVTWTNQDSTNHTITENDGKNGPSAPPTGHGESYSFTFNEAGTFHYHCSIHPEMTGTVTVTD